MGGLGSIAHHVVGGRGVAGRHGRYVGGGEDAQGGGLVDGTGREVRGYPTAPDRHRLPPPRASPVLGRGLQVRTDGHGSRDCVGPDREWTGGRKTQASRERCSALIRVMTAPLRRRVRVRHHLQYQRADQVDQVLPLLHGHRNRRAVRWE